MHECAFVAASDAAAAATAAAAAILLLLLLLLLLLPSTYQIDYQHTLVLDISCLYFRLASGVVIATLFISLYDQP